MTIDERLERLTGIVESLAASVVSHDDQTKSLLTLAEKHDHAISNLERQWQAYINTLPKH